ncbi:hypothetical protein L1049_021033 [Liquidambar formosana]|uniref:FRIGIDA-like protein n=1 Tax=Liquidambar formosana TaxID=63359 RepID=A0AAP0X4T6_LIQFO
MKPAFDWMTKVRPAAKNYLEVLGFLLLVASYGLAPAFDEDELVSLFRIVAQQRQAPELCRVLGLADMFPYFIWNLIMKKQQLDAIKFIYACGLVENFPPVPLLKDYLKFSKHAAWRIIWKGNKSIEAQNEAINKRIADLRAVIRCIKDHKLASEYSPMNIKKLILQLKRKREKHRLTVPTPASNAQLQQHSEKKCTVSPAPAPSPITAPTPVHAPMAQPQHQSRNTHPWTAVSEKVVQNASVGAVSTGNSIQPHQRQPAGLYPDQGSRHRLSEPGYSGGKLSFSGPRADSGNLVVMTDSPVSFVAYDLPP